MRTIKTKKSYLVEELSPDSVNIAVDKFVTSNGEKINYSDTANKPFNVVVTQGGESETIKVDNISRDDNNDITILHIKEREISDKYPYEGQPTGKKFRIGATLFIALDPETLDNVMDGEVGGTYKGDFTFNGKVTINNTPTNPTDAVNIQYLNNVLASLNAGENEVRVDMEAVAGEDIPADTIVRYKEIDGKIYIADKDDTTITDKTVFAYAKDAITEGNSGKVYQVGETPKTISGYTGAVYLGNNGAVLTAEPSSNAWIIGKVIADGYLNLIPKALKQNDIDARKGSFGIPNNENRFVTEDGFAKASAKNTNNQITTITLDKIDWNYISGNKINTNIDYTNILDTDYYISIPTIKSSTSEQIIPTNQGLWSAGYGSGNKYSYYMIAPVDGDYTISFSVTGSNRSWEVFVNNTAYESVGQGDWTFTHTLQKGDIFAVGDKDSTNANESVSNVVFKGVADVYNHYKISNITSNTIILETSINNTLLNQNYSIEKSGSGSIGNDVYTTLEDFNINSNFTESFKLLFILATKISDDDPLERSQFAVYKNDSLIYEWGGGWWDYEYKNYILDVKAGDNIKLKVKDTNTSGSGTPEYEYKISSNGVGASVGNTDFRNLSKYSKKAYKASGIIKDNNIYFFTKDN